MVRKLFTVFTFAILLIGGLTSAEAVDYGASFQIHNPPGSGNPEGGTSKSQFVMRNDSSAGTDIVSILFTFPTGVFFDTTAVAPGYGSFLDYLISPAQTYSSSFSINVLAASNTVTGYTGLTNIANGATSLSLTFNSFNSGDAFGFWTDLDKTGVTTGRIGNSDLNGLVTQIVFSDGHIINHTWVTPNNSGRTSDSQFFVEGGGGPTGVVPEPATMLLFASGLSGLALRRKKS